MYDRPRFNCLSSTSIQNHFRWCPTFLKFVPGHLKKKKHKNVFDKAYKRWTEWIGGGGGWTKVDLTCNTSLLTARQDSLCPFWIIYFMEIWLTLLPKKDLFWRVNFDWSVHKLQTYYRCLYSWLHVGLRCLYFYKPFLQN